MRRHCNGHPLNYKRPRHARLDVKRYKASGTLAIDPFDLIALDTPIFDQAEQGSCTANALCKVFDFRTKFIKRPAIISSRDYLYRAEEQLDGDINTDSGSTNQSGAQVFKTKGVCLETTWPYSMTDLMNQPPASADAEAANYKATGTELAQDAVTIQQSILKGNLVAFGIQLYSGFSDVGADGVYADPGPNDTYLGGHDMVIIGWRKVNGILCWVIDNSWGTDWGMGGRCFINISQTMDPNICSEFMTLEPQ